MYRKKFCFKKYFKDWEWERGIMELAELFAKHLPILFCLKL